MGRPRKEAEPLPLLPPGLPRDLAVYLIARGFPVLEIADAVAPISVEGRRFDSARVDRFLSVAKHLGLTVTLREIAAIAQAVGWVPIRRGEAA